MPETYNTTAIILNRYPKREHDTQVVLYTKEKGKIELLARGTKKTSSKLAAHLEPITISRIMVVRGKNFDYVGSAISENCYLSIKNNFDALITAGDLIRYFNKMVKPDEPDGNTYDLLEKFLDILERDSLKSKPLVNDSQLLLRLFLLKLAAESGYRPELRNCVFCKRTIEPHKNFFSVSSGGLSCPDCQKSALDRIPIQADTIKVLRAAIEGELEQLIKIAFGRAVRKEIFEITGSFLNYTFNFSL